MARNLKKKILLIRSFASLFGVFLLVSNLVCHAQADDKSFGGLPPGQLISQKAVKKKLEKKEKFLLLDARPKDSYRTAHITGAKLPRTEEYYKNEELFRQGIIPQLPDEDKALAQQMRQYKKNSEIVTYWNDHCQASVILLYKLGKLGYTNVRAMDEGFQTWQSHGYPTASDG